MSQSRAIDTPNHEFNEVVQGKILPFEKLTVDDLKNVRLMITADLGQAAMLVREVLDLKQGSIVPLDKLAGEMIDLYVNGIPLAKGEVVVIGDSLHVRVGEIFGVTASEKEAEDD
ncbi:MAG TPA: FliM/FliN family flagellar motor switch protein [Candidatus Bathyarchaeia archaeon]|nr:FliM/FliN family flagellar motor switch protein [Candidatus Bathyarchaeia archaeon]